MGDEEVHAKSIGLRIQGKIASKMSSKGLAKQVVDGPTSELIDNCYRIAKYYLESKKDAEKIMKNMIKIVVKVALLSSNNRFTKEEMSIIQNFQNKFKTIAKSIISFYEVDFTFDCEYTVTMMKDSQKLLEKLVCNHLTAKSLKRIECVYNFYSNPDVLDSVFQPGSKFRPYLANIVKSLNTLIEQGQL
ncbi:tumor necrosis factor alpha-induced protein 8-like protein isoform X2 [Hydra vulgaris]|nr:tumor necrosis factor alpha-induced protein 8-like protein isoform X2 [Hydra vulgaris]